MEVNRNMIIGFFVWLIISVSLCYFVYNSSVEELRLRYEMPNGVICKSSHITGGGFGGATNEFSACSDGKRYINPDTYRKLKTVKEISIRDALLGDNE